MIAKGPSGVIYKGSYRGSVVAVKKVKMGSMPLKPSAREAIEAALEVEATRMGSLRHPNTVLFMGACLQGDHFCIVSEYCTRGSLFNVLHNRSSSTSSSKDNPGSDPRGRQTNGNMSTTRKKVTLKWSLRLRLALGAARGLLYLHSADPPLVHGQLKSTNILVDDSWNAKLADFGTRRVAEAVGFDRNRLNNPNMDTFSLRWTAPELLKLFEDRALTGNFLAQACGSFPQGVDIYSFGILMWELTSGEIPFSDLQTNHEIKEYVLSGCRPVIKPGQCSIKWAELMARCWSQNASRRPTAAEIVSTLENISKTEASFHSSSKKKDSIRGFSSRRADHRYDTGNKH
jgi:serine/threonine protein kinase